MTYLTVDDCPICHSKDRDIYFKGTAGDHAAKTMDVNNYACTTSSYGRYVDLMKCRHCQLIYARVQPSAAALQEAYSTVEDQIYLNQEDGRVKTFGRAVDDLGQYCPQRGRLFEFGSYTGVFLDLAREDGWEIDGLELSHWARDIASKKRGILLRASMDVNATDLSQAYDCVAIWDVIEHVPDPVAMIKQAADMLKPGGVLALSTIVLDSLSARLLREKYPFLMEMHIIYFTRKTLLSLLTQAGFEILAYKRHARFVSYWYLLSRVKQLAFIYEHPYFAGILKKHYIQLSVGLRDVYARKKVDQ